MPPLAVNLPSMSNLRVATAPETATFGSCTEIENVSPKIDCEILVWLRSPSASTGPDVGWRFSTDEVERSAPSSSVADALPEKLASCTVLELPQTKGEFHDVAQEEAPALPLLSSQLGEGAP